MLNVTLLSMLFVYHSMFIQCIFFLMAWHLYSTMMKSWTLRVVKILLCGRP